MNHSYGIGFSGLILNLKLFCLVLLFQNCSGFESDQTAQASQAIEATQTTEEFSLENATYEYIFDKILTKKCLHCHNNKMAGGGVYFTSYEKLIKSNVLQPFESEKSPLYLSVLSGDMPLGNEALSNVEVELIEKWIDLGALESEELPEESVVDIK